MKFVYFVVMGMAVGKEIMSWMGIRKNVWVFGRFIAQSKSILPPHLYTVRDGEEETCA